MRSLLAVHCSCGCLETSGNWICRARLWRWHPSHTRVEGSSGSGRCVRSRGADCLRPGVGGHPVRLRGAGRQAPPVPLHPHRPGRGRGARFLEAKLRPIDFDNQTRHRHEGVRAGDPARPVTDATFVVGFAPDGFKGRLVGPNSICTVARPVQRGLAARGPAHRLAERGSEDRLARGAPVPQRRPPVQLPGRRAWPMAAAGSVRLNKDSRVLWKLERNTHSTITLEPGRGGRLRVPSGIRTTGRMGCPIPGRSCPALRGRRCSKSRPRPGSWTRSRCSRPCASWPALFSLNHENDLDVVGEDRTQLNDVEPLPAALAPRFPAFRGRRPPGLDAQHQHDSRDRCPGRGR